MPHVDFTMESGLLDRVITLCSWFLVTNGALWLVVIRGTSNWLLLLAPCSYKEEKQEKEEKGRDRPGMGKGRAGYFKPMKMRPCLLLNQPKPQAYSFRHSEAALP